MKNRNRSKLMILALMGFLAGAGCSSGDKAGQGDQSASTPTPAVQETTPAAAESAGPRTFTGADTLWNHPQPLGEPVASFGDDPPSWTPTTTGAANRGLTGRPATVVGEVVDVSCYMQLGKRGEAHIPCGTHCVENGAPIGLVDARNDLYIVMAEEHDPRRYGNVALKEAMLPFMAKTVQITGMLTEREGVKTLYVRGYTVGDDPNQPRVK
jgi:hypothetical protein